MRIESIELLNFGSYEGVNRFDFTGSSPEQRIIIIGGKNGAGKTTLFSALQICLYGYASFGYKSPGKRYLREISARINNRARLDESSQAYVRLSFSQDGVLADRYEMTRAWSWSGEAVSETLTIVQNGRPLDEEAAVNFQNYLLHLIPPELHKLYFFDGEKIAEYFLDDAHNNMKDALLVLSGNDTYEILYRDLRRLLNAGGGQDDHLPAGQYLQQKEVLAQNQQAEQSILDSLEQIRDEIERLEAELDGKRARYAAGGGISLDDWKRLQHQSREEEGRRERLNGELKTAAGEILPFLIVRELLPAVREQITLERRLLAYRVLQSSLRAAPFKRRLSAAVKKTTSQDPAGDAAILLDSIQSFFQDAGLEGKPELFRLSEDQGAAILNTIAAVEQYPADGFERLREELADSLQRSRSLREQLQESSIEHYEEFLRAVSDDTAVIQRLKDQREQLECRLPVLRENIKSAEKAVAASKSVLTAALKQRSLTDLTERTLLLVEDLQQQQYHKLIAAVEADLNRKFRELIRKEEFVDYIALHQDFSLHVIRSQAVETAALRAAVEAHGPAALRSSLKPIAYQALLQHLAADETQLPAALASCREPAILLPVELDYTQFSNWEKQILVMSLYWAIMNQSQNTLPFMIDTPFARIDTEHRSNITEKFFKELPGQLFVLSTNEELRREHLAALDAQIAKVYLLEYGADRRTHITEGSYF